MNAWKPWIHSRYKIAVALAMTAGAACSAEGGSTTGDTSGGGGNTTSAGTMAGPGPGSAQASTGSSGGCPNEQMAAVATHITMEVTWPGTVGIEAGAGQVHLWTLSTQTYSGNNIMGTGRACGSKIPDLQGTFVAGGKLIGNDIPDATWEAPTMPVLMITGSFTSFDVGASVTINKTVNLVGTTMANPETDPWPQSYTGLMAVDHDGDGKPGITAIPKSGGNYQEPPVNLFMNPRADRLYLATRSILTLMGTRTSCPEMSGTAMVEKFDNHVVGCRVTGGADCMPAEAQFVDDNRTIFAIGNATFKSKVIPSPATCADARAALP